MQMVVEVLGKCGHPGGSATAGIFVLRVPNAYNITSPGGSTSNDSDYKYLQRTSPGNSFP